MEEPLDLTTNIVPLLALSIKLVGGALDIATTTSCEAADQLKALQRDLEGLEKQVLLVQTNFGALSTNSGTRRSNKLLRRYVLSPDTVLALEALVLISLFLFPAETASEL